MLEKLKSRDVWLGAFVAGLISAILFFLQSLGMSGESLDDLAEILETATADETEGSADEAEATKEGSADEAEASDPGEGSGEGSGE